MRRRLRLLLLMSLAFGCLGLSALAADPPNPPASANPVPDVSKRMMEAPTRRLVDSSTPSPTDFVNPRRAPGKIAWHPTWEAALTASARSGKPILLFQLLGKLDLEFC
ncbi:MAG TPA: hypothetical protein PKD86_14030 [Gemmatales bacterium]|nr:hypothetical protein [Gemmatales bacterium]HMP60462.1 hypothetical protein [Gemmatales bacterium]